MRWRFEKRSEVNDFDTFEQRPLFHGFVEFDTNRYSVPSAYANTTAEVLAYADHLEIVVRGKHIANHPRSWEPKQKWEGDVHKFIS